ncbi:MAG: alcohol dehydrogenase [Planctomycetaceae bacterium]|nr:alcohol dehydrogenase [Planctomycetaceae bacterium]HAA67521.1 alcohol dehydrogenase [Planctomycetaceae bacterium]|tara:strand:- start:4145 stop:5350 length:1206 start_codon:yes stop_codon:yes gene_type:complete
MRTTWNFNTAGQLVFGRNAVDQIGDRVREMGARRLLLVTDQTLLEAGLVDRVSAPLRAANVTVEVFAGGSPEPPLHAVNDAIAAARDCGAEVLLGLGGGSNMDIAKAAAVVLTHGGAVKDYAGDQVVPGPVFPLILVPTTSGTGSEVTAAAVLNDTDQGAKFSILSNHLRARFAVVDPLLTVSCPPAVTAASGIDALSHAVEAYTAVDNEAFPLPAGEATIYQGRHPLGDLLAERAIGLIGENLRRAVNDGDDLDAREGMALASTLAGMSFSNSGVAVVHALEYPLNDTVHTPHGVGCGLFLPYVMRFTGPARPQQMARIAELLASGDPVQRDDSAVERAAAAVEKLNADIGIPLRLRDVGISEAQLPAMADKAFTVKRILRVSPRSVAHEDLTAILRAAL